MRRILCLALALASASVIAQTYRWVDPATGKTMFTDSPPPANARDKRKAEGAGDSNNQSFAVRRAAENFPVTLYTSAECLAPCKNARDLLNGRGVPFNEKMVQSEADFAELKQLVGDHFLPSVKVGRQTYRGFQADAYNNLLDLAGYPKNAPPGSKPSGFGAAADKP